MCFLLFYAAFLEAIRAMLTPAFATVTSFEVILFSENNVAIFRGIKIAFLQLVSFPKSAHVFRHGTKVLNGTTFAKTSIQMKNRPYG